MTPTLFGAGCIILGVALFAAILAILAILAICAVIGAARMRTPEEQAREDRNQLAALRDLHEGRR